MVGIAAEIPENLTFKKVHTADKLLNRAQYFLLFLLTVPKSSETP